MAALSAAEFDPLTALSFSGEDSSGSMAFWADSGLASAGGTSQNRLVFVDASLPHLDTLTQTLEAEKVVLIDTKDDGEKTFFHFLYSNT